MDSLILHYASIMGFSSALGSVGSANGKAISQRAERRICSHGMSGEV